jgi:hypothetical protein
MMMQEFSHIYEGTAFDGKTGSGIAEFDCAGYDHAVRFKADAAAAIARLTFDIIKHGQGADLLVELRDSFNPDGSALGSLLRYHGAAQRVYSHRQGIFQHPNGYIRSGQRGLLLADH